MDEAGAVLHQGMTGKSELGLHACALAIEPGVRVRRRGVRLIGALLALETGFRVAPGAGRQLLAGAVLGLEALHRRPGLDQRAVNKEMPV